MKGFYINLDCRLDRKRHIQNNILTIDFFKELNRLPAIFEPKDSIGCLKSWIQALEKCLDYDDDKYLIIEDDLSIDNDIIFNNFINDYEKIKDNDDWGIITFTPHWDNKNNTDITVEYPEKVGNFHKIWNTYTLTGIIIKQNTINVFLNNLKECLNLYKIHGIKNKVNNEVYKVDIYWFKVQKKMNIICYQEDFSSQLEGITNNLHNVDQGHRFKDWDTHGRCVKGLLKNLVLRYINNPQNDYNCFYLAREYEKNKQLALAVSYYLKCADYTNYKELEYESLIRISLCFCGMGNRDSKELSSLETAISILPNRPEAYNLLSLYHSFRSEWKKGYMYAVLGLDNNDTNNYELYYDCSYEGRGKLLFQKAYCGHHIGKILESVLLYEDIIYDNTIDESIRIISKNNLNDLNCKTDRIRDYIVYSKEKFNSLRYKFNGSEDIKKNYSEIYQDMFVLSMCNGKKDGTYLEIGSNDPFLGNNTYLLEKQFNWSGISIDNDYKCVRDFKSYRKNECLFKNALEIDYSKLLEKYKTIDYLQLDCDPPNITYEILMKLPFDKVKFGVITYEHDYYIDDTKKYRELSRGYLYEMGYKMVVGNISPCKDNKPFEDWWIHPDLIDINIYNSFITDYQDSIFGEDYMLNKLLTNKIKPTKIGINVGSGLGETNYLFNDEFKIIQCFEPNEYSYNYSKQNINDEKYKLYNYGISDKDGYSKFNNCEHNGYSSILEFDEKGEFYELCNVIDNGFNKVNNVTQIKVKRLDTFIKENNITKIDLLKIDTQGHDLNVIKSLGNKLDIVDKIILECQLKVLYKNSHTKEEIVKYMKEHNFNLIDSSSTSESTVGYEENLIFERKNIPLYNYNIPELIVVDNFYKNPDSIRCKALDFEYLGEDYHGAVGNRCEKSRLATDEAKDYFEKLLGKKIKIGNDIGEWSYSTNGCFQWCSKDTPIVYHCDSQEYAGIIFLTPDAPVNCGTSIFRHKKYKIKDNSIFSEQWTDKTENQFTDPEPWEEVDRIGNIYNRLVLFKSHNVHGVSEYFGETIENSRLFQLFFFDVE